MKSVCHFSKIKKVTLILKKNDEKVFSQVSFWMLINKVSNLLHTNFKNVANEYYMVSPQSYLIQFEIIVEVRLIYFIYAFLRNIKDLPKVIKAIRS